MQLSGWVIGHLATVASGKEIMTIIFISPTCCLTLPCSSIQDSPSAWPGRDSVSSISFSAGVTSINLIENVGSD